MPKILTRYVSLWDFWVSFPNERCLLMMMSLEVWFLCGVLFATGSLRIGWIGQELSKGVAENVRDCFYLSTVPQKRCLDSLCVIKSSSQVFGLGRPVVPSYCNFPKLTTNLSHLRSGQVCAGVKLGSRFLYYCWHRRQEHCRHKWDRHLNNWQRWELMETLLPPSLHVFESQWHRFLTVHYNVVGTLPSPLSLCVRLCRFSNTSMLRFTLNPEPMAPQGGSLSIRRLSKYRPLFIIVCCAFLPFAHWSWRRRAEWLSVN